MRLPVLIGLDADDTLWHHESHYHLAHQRLHALLARWADADRVATALAEVERRNLGLFGYGAKGFTLSMLETALDVGGAEMPATVLAQILQAGRALMRHPIDPLPSVAEALPRLAAIAPLVLITNGDLFPQESKLAASEVVNEPGASERVAKKGPIKAQSADVPRGTASICNAEWRLFGGSSGRVGFVHSFSGLGRHFAGVEVVSEKTADTYSRVFARHGAEAARALMAGNSVRSDVLPALEAGSEAVLIPYPLVWAHESAQVPDDHPRFRRCDTLGALADWLEARA